MKHIPHKRIKERVGGPHLVKHEHLGFNGKIALFITNKFGSMGAFYILVAWMFIWMTLATLKIGVFKTDPYPFVFLLFLSNLIQLWALPVLAVGQQVLSKASDKQAQQVYKDAEALLEIQDEVHRLVKLNDKLTKEIHAKIVKSRKVK